VTTKSTLITRIYLIMGRQFFVFLFRRGTEQPHQGNMIPYQQKIHFEDAIRSEDPVQLFCISFRVQHKMID
jgi:hypothetical protein